jgi:hypothetical protein
MVVGYLASLPTAFRRMAAEGRGGFKPEALHVVPAERKLTEYLRRWPATAEDRQRLELHSRARANRDGAAHKLLLTILQF